MFEEITQTYRHYTWTDIPKLLIVLWLSFHVAFLVHEFGHYLMARLWGVRMHEVVVGDHITVYDRVHDGTRFVFRLICPPWSTAHNRTGEGSMRLIGMLCIVLCGPITNILVGLPAVLLGLRWDASILVTVGCISVILGLSNFLPSGGSDGEAAWYLITKHRLP